MMRKVLALILCLAVAMPAMAMRHECTPDGVVTVGGRQVTVGTCRDIPENAADRKALREAAKATSNESASTYSREDDRPRALDLRVIQDNGLIKTVVDEKTGKFYLCSKNSGCI